MKSVIFALLWEKEPPTILSFELGHILRPSLSGLAKPFAVLAAILKDTLLLIARWWRCKVHREPIPKDRPAMNFNQSLATVFQDEL